MSNQQIHVQNEAQQDIKMARINNICFFVPQLQKTIRIRPAGKSMLIIGQNGAGKTSFLNTFHNALERYINSYEQKKRLRSKTEQHIGIGRHNIPGINTHTLRKDEISSYRNAMNNSIVFAEGMDHFIPLLKADNGVFAKFEAGRRANIREASGAHRIPESSPNRNINPLHGYSSDFEQHLVNLKVQAALQAAEGDNKTANEISEWFDELEQKIKYLFEDDSTRLTFQSANLRFTLSQDSKAHFSFQSLSSGYSAIFDILGDLIIRTEYQRITPSKLQGIVFIDEIDAHLHVSLQRKVLPFFLDLFPSIQFIVTTHSPFVVTSADNVLIYDLSSGKTAMDLSMYSIEAILEGILGVPPISKKLETKIAGLRRMTSHIDSSAIEPSIKLINEIQPYIDELDPESRMHFELSKINLSKYIR